MSEENKEDITPEIAPEKSIEDVSSWKQSTLKFLGRVFSISFKLFLLGLSGWVIYKYGFSTFFLWVLGFFGLILAMFAGFPDKKNMPFWITAAVIAGLCYYLKVHASTALFTGFLWVLGVFAVLFVIAILGTLAKGSWK